MRGKPRTAAEWDERLRALRATLELRNDLLPYRDVEGGDCDWQKSPAGTDESLRRFLVARQGNIDNAVAMYVAHLEWRSRVFPLPRTGKVAEILRQKRRFTRLAPRDDGTPVLMVHHLWGHFISEREPDITALDCLRACIRFMEDEISLAEANGHPQAVCISYGGPPQIGFVTALAHALQANYPERLLTACIYPVPKLVTRITWGMLWMLDEHTRAKVSVHCDEDTFLESLRYRREQLPEDMRGGFHGVVQRNKPDQARMNRLLRTGMLQNRGEGAELIRRLQEERPEVVEDDDVAAAAAEEEPAISIWPSSWLACCCAARPHGGPHDGAPPRLARSQSPAFESATAREVVASSGKVSAGRPSTMIMALLFAVLVAVGLRIPELVAVGWLAG